ncbi:hypothetical protein BDQ17DRAFT_1344087 [Cyathus striatus]|nr:hypothetical protein BDQ17DRAFT_1344087 [Cyathus striatus]
MSSANLFFLINSQIGAASLTRYHPKYHPSVEVITAHSCLCQTPVCIFIDGKKPSNTALINLGEKTMLVHT